MIGTTKYVNVSESGKVLQQIIEEYLLAIEAAIHSRNSLGLF